MKLSDKQLFALSMLGIVLVSLLNVLITPSESQLEIDHPYSGGIQNLRLWLEQSGYEIDPVADHATDLGKLEVLFMIKPYFSDQASLSKVKDWVEDGGTLILVGVTDATGQILDFYRLNADPVANQLATLQAGPTLVTPPIMGDLRLDHAYGLVGWERARVDPVIHITMDDTPVVVSWGDGEGMVWYVGSIYPFTNQGLHNSTSPLLILNLLAGTSEQATIGFSEGLIQSGETFFDLLIGSSFGWGILSAIGITYLYLALRGRRFGSPVPLPQERLRREPIEYIQAMANLYRYSGDRQEILKHYHRQVRRRLIQRYGLDATLNDKALIEIAAQRDSSIDKGSLTGLFASLTRQRMSEAELVRAAQSADDWLNKMEKFIDA